MKKAIRWIGVGIVALAAFSLLLADMVLAAPASQPGLSPARQQLAVSFDLLSPRGITCEATGPGRITHRRDLFGKPRIEVFGHAETTDITCRTADGQTFGTEVQKTLTYRPGHVTEVKITYRPGATAGTVIVTTGDREDILRGAFRALN